MENNEINRLDMKSMDVANSNIEKLKELFPNIVIEGKIDFDTLKQELSTDIIEDNKEKYQLTWPGKKEAIVIANTPTKNTLRPLKDKSVNFEKTENLYIEGDNLETLKILQESYLNKIKLIYIDPPYNTGNDFVYNDTFVSTSKQEIEKSGLIDAEGNKLISNQSSNGRYHSNWLSMMYPRLKLARNLLKEDGLIFISIDDNEYDNLKKICDEIFGENNFINHFAWVSNITGRQIAGQGAAKTWESILVYSKNIDECSDFKININFAKTKMPDTYKGFEKDIREDEYGKFAVGDTLYNHNRKFNEETRKNLVFSIYYNPETNDIVPDDIGVKKEGYFEILPHANGDGIHKYHAWRWSKDKINNESKDLIVLPNSTNGYEIYTKIRSFNTTILKDLITNITNGDAELQKLFNGKKYFDYPKSTDLLKTIIGCIDLNNEIVLDFFSGSATTAHAVMQLNKEDGGNRKFILVQLEEEINEKSSAFKDGFKTICDIGEQRIKNVISQLGDDTLGFRVYKVDSSNMKDVYYEPSKLDQAQLNMFESNIKEDRTAEDLLTQVILDLGLTLDLRIEEKNILNNKVYYLAENSLVACFDDQIDIEIVDTICECKPLKVVFKDVSFKTDKDKINLEERIKKNSSETEISIL